VIIGVKISGKEADKEHSYGHERLECVASIILALMLALTGVGIGIEGVNKIVSGDYGSLSVPGMVALVAAIVSIVVKEVMYWYTRGAAKKIHSGALMADAWHHRSDALSSVGSFVGIFAARLGYPIMDPIASVLICLFIWKAAYDIFRDAIGKLIDEACDEETQQQIRELIICQPGVKRLDELKTRKFGPKIYVDVEISADGQLTLCEGHEIAQLVQDKVESEFPLVKHCMVHMNPYECTCSVCAACQSKQCNGADSV
jgi:cation diffusion facilitator family transporter